MVDSWRDRERTAVPKLHPDNPKRSSNVLFDILIALLITAVAVVLGITVHPLLFLLIVFAVIYLFTRHAGSRRHVL